MLLAKTARGIYDALLQTDLVSALNDRPGMFDLIVASDVMLYLGELADFTEQIDGFIPTASLLGLYVGWRKGFLFRRGGTSVTPTEPLQP